MTGEPARQEEPSLGDLTADEARGFLEQHVRATRWGWRGLSKRLPIESFERSGAFDVIFQSFTEQRAVRPTYRSYSDGPVDGPEGGPEPGPWEMEVAMPGNFISAHRALPVPHTQEVRTCHVCSGIGKVRCPSCSGTGRTMCRTCAGAGRVDRTTSETDAQGNSTTKTFSESCSTCSGVGQVRCIECAASGRITCGTCDGKTRLLHYRELQIEWATRRDGIQIEKTALPDDLVGLAQGVVALREEAPRLEQGRGVPGGGPYRGAAVRVNAEVEQAANQLIASHTFAEGHKLHRQRLVVRAVPVHEARYRFRNQERSFWVYGTDCNVYAPDYPRSPLRVGAAIAAGALVMGGLLAALSPSRPSRPADHRSVSAVSPPATPASRRPPAPAPPRVEGDAGERAIEPAAPPGGVK